MTLSTEQVEQIVKVVKRESEKHDKKKRKETKDYRLRNTTLLLKNYRMLKAHCQGIEEELDEYENIVYDPSELNLNTLMRYKAKTRKMIEYFESVFKAYEELAKRNGETMWRRYQVVSKMYVMQEKQSADAVAEFYNIDRRTVFRDSKKAIEELSVLLWGVDSFDDLI